MEIQGILIILTGKTASGKDTIMQKILQQFPQMDRIISTTSRPPRKEEKNGQDYNFISREDFKKKVENGDFLEYVEYGGNLYGTEKTEIKKVFKQDLIWRIDPSRAGQIREFIKNAFGAKLADALLQKVLVIYLTVDNQTILERLERRKISRDEIQSRMEQDSKFWESFKQNYDFVVENIPGRLDETVDKVMQIINNIRQ